MRYCWIFLLLIVSCGTTQLRRDVATLQERRVADSLRLEQTIGEMRHVLETNDLFLLRQILTADTTLEVIRYNAIPADPTASETK